MNIEQILILLERIYNKRAGPSYLWTWEGTGKINNDGLGKFAYRVNLRKQLYSDVFTYFQAYTLSLEIRSTVTVYATTEQSKRPHNTILT